ncbi:MAG TPA: N-acetyl-gamma-glutamyl-phosphate reductase [Candidatus Omnitrophica bacterium]|nr:N-acetyl-gamma-glutamyl-phosphate reductase [Candidatus Omnitrophota bacterium]
MSLKRVAVIGATGYVGVELTRFLLRHPSVQITRLTTSQPQGVGLRTLLPEVHAAKNYQIVPYSKDDVIQSSDVVFLCLPHTEAMQHAGSFLSAGKTVIDLSADFRLKNPAEYPVWYAVEHLAPELLAKSVYGLPEFYREQVEKADLIANPGCYPTSVLLGLLPLVKKKLIDLKSITVSSASGVSGAGKKPSATTHFCEAHENFFAYKVGKHQHTPEIEQILSEGAGTALKVDFTTHLLPVNRGILSTIYAKKNQGVTEEQVRAAYEEFYGKSLFVRLKNKGEFPALKDVQHSNFCDLGVLLNPRTDTVTVLAAIDNLVKGAAGQAVQNFNIRFGFEEGTALL